MYTELFVDIGIISLFGWLAKAAYVEIVACVSEYVRGQILRARLQELTHGRE